MGKHEYQTTVRDCDDFTRAVTHDLSAPLRHIRQFSALLRESLGNEISEEQQRFIDTIQHSADREEAMLYELLQLGTVAVEQSTFREVDISRLLKKIGDKLADSRLDIHIDFTPIIYGDEKLLYVLFSNLLVNPLTLIKPPATTNIVVSGGLFDQNTWIFNIREQCDTPNKDRRLHQVLNNTWNHRDMTVCHQIIRLHGGKLLGETTENGQIELSVILPSYNKLDK